MTLFENSSAQESRQRGGGNDRRGAMYENRRGATTVELALVCPILFTFLFAALEFARVHQINNASSVAAYKACRRAIIPGATAAQAAAAGQVILDAGLVKGATIIVNPSTITDATLSITVTVSVKLDSNAWVIPTFTSGNTISRSCTLTREKTN